MKIKTLLMIVFIVLLLAALGIGGFLIYKKKVNYENQIAERDTTIMNLQVELANIGEMVTVYQTAYNVISGTEVKEADLVPVQVPLKVASAYVQDPSLLVGKYYKLNTTAGTPLSEDLVAPFEITPDMRYLDVVCDEIPIGLAIDDYVDVRISFTFGQDFIGMTHKRVAGVFGKTIKLIVDQKDVYTYESMKVDKSLYKGTKIYALEYLEAGSQKGADNYYPMRAEVLTTVVQDPNISSTEEIKSFTIVNRSYLEQQLSNTELVQSVGDSKRELLSAFEQANEAYKQLLQEQAIEAERQAQIAAQEAAAAAAAEQSGN